ncbi:SlyX protein [Roseovarius sp. TE539]|uniref:SlyX family protein n=1 Tax=Roseovarius sp. TE539 TaxID=2249812 RepID=UPI000DE0F652|nr:SlyX family protein [Roseovarius sp. TE539]RBI77159.1 SlyX protein [Roseovarius sp. TE539]
MREIEEQIAHLTRAVEDLSDTVARQETEIAALRTRLDLLMSREAARATGEGDSGADTNRPPPHW